MCPVRPRCGPLRVEGGVPELRSVALDLARAAARLHRFDWRSAGLSSAEPVDRADCRARPSWRSGRTSSSGNASNRTRRMVWAFEWLRRNAPPLSGCRSCTATSVRQRVVRGRPADGAARLGDDPSRRPGRGPGLGLPSAVEPRALAARSASSWPPTKTSSARPSTRTTCAGTRRSAR